MPGDRLTIKLMTEDLSLVDIWRLVNPCKKEYTFFSHMHKSLSRIDYFRISKGLIEDVLDCKTGVIALTNHTPVESNIGIGPNRTRVTV